MIMLMLIILVLLMTLGWLFWHRSFLWRSLRMAWRSGRLGPAIDEKDQFPNKLIPATHPVPWPVHDSYGQLSLSAEALAKTEALGSTAFLVIHDGQLVYERYWAPFTADTPTNAFSVAKSVVCILIGMAQHRGLLHIDDPVSRYLPSFGEGGKDAITIRHLLMMSSGLSWSESEGSLFSDNAEAYYGHDTAAIIKRLRLRRPPGEVFRYASGNTQILAMILKAAVGYSVADYAARDLWPVIGAESDAHWNLDYPGGPEKAFCCLYATPRDFARLGQLYLQKGKWEGQRLLDQQFVQECLTPVPMLDIWLNKPNVHYGLHWWTSKYHGNTYFYARGIRGQYVIVNEARKLIIVRMGHRRNPVDRHHGHPPDLFDHINAGLEIFTSIPQ